MADSILTREYMHLPVWAWGIFGVSGFYLLMQYRKNKGSGSTQPAQQQQTAAAASTSSGGGPNSIFFLPNGAAPNQVGVNFNSRADQQISSTYVTPSNMFAAQIEQAVYHSNANDPTSIAVDSTEIIQANPQLDWTRAIPKGTSVNVPVGIGTQG